MTHPAPDRHRVRLDRARLAPPGRRPADAARWTARAGAALIVIALGLLVFTALRPLPAPAFLPPDSPPAIPSVAPIDPAFDHRREQLARLGAENLFDAEREPWSGRRAESTPDAAPDAPQAKPTSTTSTTQASINGQSVQVTRAEALPDDIKTALTGLAFRGLYTPPGTDQPVALISRVHGGPNPLVADPFRVGDEFEDKQHPQAKWRVIAIDVQQRRVILQRNGVNAALVLYTAGPVAGAPSAEAPEPEAATPAVPTLTIQTVDEIKAALRESKFSDEEIDRLLKLAEMSPDDAAASAKIAALAEAAKKANTTGRRPPPPGLEGLTRLLQQPPPTDSGAESSSPARGPDARPRNKRGGN